MMSAYARPLAILIVLAIVVIGMSLLLRRNTTVPEPLEAKSEEFASQPQEVDVRTQPQSISPRRAMNLKTTPAPREVTSGVKTIALHTPAALPPLTGYMLDQFATWKNIPEGYRAENIVARNGAVTLAGDAGSTEARTGILISPPLPLKAPAMAAPAIDSSVLPEGAGVLLEISLTEDGEAWSPWAVAQRYAPPDGKRVLPPRQAQISSDEIAATDRETSASIDRPAIRYRLTLSASGATPPQVRDVRVWKQENK